MVSALLEQGERKMNMTGSELNMKECFQGQDTLKKMPYNMYTIYNLHICVGVTCINDSTNTGFGVGVKRKPPPAKQGDGIIWRKFATILF